MNAAAPDSLWWQYLIIGIIVAASALSVLRKYLPSVWGRGLALGADALEHRRAPALLRRAGALLRRRIPASVGAACASSGGCSSCGACASTPAAGEPAPPVMVLAEPRPRRPD
ncbi:DUF6587 family protein [Tahibacter harae]|uniref:Uncharacterized protein n=1 Tax=Tahibacter harae TaxID=2963937 RepID=A0ABT1QSV7_9GAMM|nr:DUF6587 family protein [Tahibacter harae]MCQ4165370.1 hypothetical protein [Tahibacter harae]